MAKKAAKKTTKKTTKKAIPSDDSLVISLDFDKKNYTAAQKQTLVFSLTNTSDKAIRVLKWHTPLEGMKSDMFHVEVNGNLAVYMGRVYKRPAPTEDDYITIDPGQTVSEDVDFTEAYDIAEAGIYSVKYRTAPASCRFRRAEGNGEEVRGAAERCAGGGEGGDRHL